MDSFLDTETTKEAVIHAGIAIFQYIYHGPDTTLGEIHYNMFSRKAAAGVIKPETLPPTKGVVAQHALRAYLQTQDWILLQSIPLNPSDCGWTLGVHGYEPVPTLDPMAPEDLLKFTSCNCHAHCSNRQCSCKKNGMYISACGVCKGITCKTAVMMLLSLKKVDNDSWSFRHWGWDINNSEYYISMWNKSYFVNVKVSVAFFSNIGCLLCMKHICQ